MNIGQRKSYGFKLQVIEEGQQSDRNDISVVAEIGKDIDLCPGILDTYNVNGWQPVHQDLLMVCAAVAFADKHRARRITGWSRQLSVDIPVRELGVWQQPNVKLHLCDTLRHLTGDQWHFSFSKASGSSLGSMNQRALPFCNRKEFIMAYSDGLDSRCVAGLYDADDTAVCVRVTKSKDRVKNEERLFDQIPFKVKSNRSESSFRSRGFIFASVTAIVAQLCDVSRIIVPESGQGALGPALLPLHKTVADYRCHPTFFRKMECFIRALLGYTVNYDQPRLWYTKGETIEAFMAQYNRNAECVINTRSCWQQQWNVRGDEKVNQCGICAACLLRRMSMLAAGIDEPVSNYTFQDLTQQNHRDAISENSSIQISKSMLEYGSVGARHFHQLANMATLPASDLRPHVFQIMQATGSTEQDTHKNLRRLLMKHAEEWRAFVSAHGKRSFINRWALGGHYG